MIELVLVYCLSDTPNRCVERREPMGPNASAVECTMSAQRQALEYVEAHPKYRLMSWRCEVDRPQQQPV